MRRSTRRAGSWLRACTVAEENGRRGLLGAKQAKLGPAEDLVRRRGDARRPDKRVSVGFRFSPKLDRLFWANFARFLAGRTGLEPAASGVTGRRYNRLNYRPNSKLLLLCFLLLLRRLPTTFRWAGQGLNLRHPACKASALPLSYPPKRRCTKYSERHILVKRFGSSIAQKLKSLPVLREKCGRRKRR